MILGLTATFERLDGRHEILAKYAPIVDTITMEDALFNGWVAKYKDYVVVIDVPDIDVYQKYNKEFNEHFEFFQWDFNKVMSMIGKMVLLIDGNIVRIPILMIMLCKRTI